MEIGIQFYTLRDYCKNLNDFSDTLERVAEIGYKNVQISGVCSFEPEWLKKELDKNGLKCVLTHTSPDKLIANPEQVAKEHDVFGCDLVGLGYYQFNEENEKQSFQHYLDCYQKVAEVLAENNKYFLHHNHDQEFKKHEGKLVIERLAEIFPPDKLGFVLDTFWIQAGGADPAFWIEKLSGRVPAIHLKDFAYGSKMAVLGEGNINFERVFEKAESAKVKYLLVEQDNCYGEDAFKCIKRSYDYLVSRGF